MKSFSPRNGTCLTCEHYYVEACKFDKPKLERGIPCSILCNCERRHLCFNSQDCEDFAPRKSRKPRVRYY